MVILLKVTEGFTKKKCDCYETTLLLLFVAFITKPFLLNQVSNSATVLSVLVCSTLASL
jgi:hypothetical protein